MYNKKLIFWSSLSMSSNNNNTVHHLNNIFNEIFPKFHTYSPILFFSFTTEPVSQPTKSVNVQLSTRLTTFSIVLISISISTVIIYDTGLNKCWHLHITLSHIFYKIKWANAIKYSNNSTNKQWCIDKDGNTAKTDLLSNRCIHQLRDKSRFAIWNALHVGQ
jgi:hypothetical protein